MCITGKNKDSINFTVNQQQQRSETLHFLNQFFFIRYSLFSENNKKNGDGNININTIFLSVPFSRPSSLKKRKKHHPYIHTLLCYNQKKKFQIQSIYMTYDQKNIFHILLYSIQ